MRKILILFFLCLHISIYSQINRGGITFPSPNAASMGLYGEIPVSLFTGIPNISIPIYNVKEKGMEYSISLTYHAGGFRPDVHPSWVGMGWNLDFGGVITRTVNKLPDEWKNDDYDIYGYYYHNRLNNWDWASTDTLASMSSPWLESRLDRQPDEFSFNFLGYSGKFYLDHTRKWRVQSNKNIKVVFEEEDIINPFFHDNIPPTQSSGISEKCFGKFILVDDQGIKYTFGTSNAIEYSSSITPPDMDYRNWLIATSWHLVDITMPDNSGGVSIEYERGPFQSNFQFFEQQDGFYNLYTCASAGGNKGITGRIISPVYAKSVIIKSDGTRIDFHFSKSNELTYPTSTYWEPFRDVNRTLALTVPPNYFAFYKADLQIPYYVNNGLTGQTGVISNARFIWFNLDSLTISAKDYTSNPVLKAFERVRFSYVENTSERLKLLSVTKASLSPGETDLSQKYSFGYNPGEMPNYLYEMSDHWGFANGRQLPVNVSGGYDWIQGDLLVYREPWDIFVSRGVLKEIIYPTGGKSSFEYELNDYKKYVMDITREYANLIYDLRKPAGGLRIKKITNDDGLGNITEREYYYVTGYSSNLDPNPLPSSGVLDRLPNYQFHVNNGSLSYWISVSTGVIPLTSSGSGLPIGYSEVVEKFNDGSYKIYKFTNHDNGYNDIDPLNTITPVGLDIPATSRGFERGHLLYEATMTAEDKILQKRENVYVRIGGGADSNFIRSVSKDYGGYCKQATVFGQISWIGPDNLLVASTVNGFVYTNPQSYLPQYTIGTAFGYYVYKFLKEKTTETTYTTDGNVLKNEVINQFDPRGNIIKTITINSKGETIYNNFKYPYQFPGIPVYDNMVAKNMISYVVESDTYKGTQFLKSEKIDFDIYAPGIVKPKQIKEKYGTNAEFIHTKFNRYGSTGNLLEMEDASGLKTTYIWSYHGTRPVAKIIGQDYNTVAPQLSTNVFAGPQQGEQPMLNEIDNLRSLFPNSFITTYLYDYKYGIKLKKDVSGRSVFYEYDGLGRLNLVRDNEGKILRKNAYVLNAQPYQMNIFFSEAKFANFYKEGCTTCYQGSTVNYLVPAGKHSSTISQADANQKAQNDINSNGQNFANTNGTCITANSCPFTNASNFDSPNANFYNENGTVYVNLVVHPINNTYGSVWYSPIEVGIVNCSCRPATTKVMTATEGDRTWEISIYSYGNVQIKLLSGPIPSEPNEYFQINISYSIN